jgi:SRSO17 transposase
MEEDWQRDLKRWLELYLEDLGNKTRRRMCPAYIAGLIGPGDRKSIQPMAARAEALSYDRLHHFIGAGPWDSAPLEATLWRQADVLVGAHKAWLIIDDTALPKKGKASVRCRAAIRHGAGKNANCQTLVSLTLASGEVPAMLGLRLFLPKSWTTMRPGWQGRACQSLSRRIEPSPTRHRGDRPRPGCRARFGCVLADAGYGLSAPFRQALSARNLCWAVGIPRHQEVYPADVQLIFPVAGRGRLRVRHVPGEEAGPPMPCSKKKSGGRSVGVEEQRDA